MGAGRSGPDLDEAFHAAWRDYETVNRAFAERVVVELDNKPDAAVLFQDYHLYLAPGYVRAARPDAELAHFVHIPWPVDWTILPEAMRRAVHEGLLANDVVAFHTARWARNFEASCDEIVGGHARTHVTHHAISIDTAEFDELAQSERVLAEERRLEARASGEARAARRPHGSVEEHRARPRGVRRSCSTAHPEWRGRARMLALLDPSRQSIPEYVEYVAAIERTTEEVNARHPGLPSTCRSRTTSSDRSRRTSSSTCCS